MHTVMMCAGGRPQRGVRRGLAVAARVPAGARAAVLVETVYTCCTVLGEKMTHHSKTQIKIHLHKRNRRKGVFLQLLAEQEI